MPLTLLTPRTSSPELPAATPVRPSAVLMLGLVLSLAYTVVLLTTRLTAWGGPVVWHLVYAVVEALAAVAFVQLGRRPGEPPAARRGWMLLGAGYAMLAVSACASVISQGSPLAAAAEIVSGWGWLLSLPAFAAGLLAFPAPTLGPRERRRILLDGLVLTGSAALLLWHVGTRGTPLESLRPLELVPPLMRLILLGDLFLVYALAVALVRAPDVAPRWAFPVMLLAVSGGALGDIFFVGAMVASPAPQEPGFGNLVWIWSAWVAAAVARVHAVGRRAADNDAPRSLIPSRIAPTIAYTAAGLLALVAMIEAVELVETDFRVLAIGGALVGALVLLRLRLALIENAELLTARAQQAEQLREAQKLEAIGRLAAGVAHEFNNLLLVIRQGTETAMAAAAPNERADVKWATDRAATITRQLLAFGRSTDTTPVIFDAASTLQQLQPLLARLVTPPGALVLQAARTAGALRTPIGDFEQIVHNLVRNAAEALNGAGAVTVTLMPDAVHPGQLVLRVSDSGRGIPPEIRERIFKPFFTTKPVGQGTGLGLAIVYGAVRDAGGTVEVDSTPGVGTTVQVRLPVHAGAAAPTAVPASTGLRMDRPCHILLVDDEAVVRSALLRTLTRMGHQVTVAVDGAEALLRLGDAPAIDLLLTDTVMPGMDGWALIAEVRQRRPDLPIVRMSGYAPAAESQSGEADAFLPKPFEREELARVLAAVLPARREPNSASA